MDKQRIVTYGEIFQIMERKAVNDKKYKLKVSYGSKDKENDYRFNLQQAMIDSRK